MPLDYRLNEQIIMLPAGIGKQAMLETTVFKPNGPGPFPLLVINHGKESGEPRRQTRDRFIYMATAFVKRGYAVMLPMRQGFSRSSGRYLDFGCDMTANGYAQASDVLDTIDYARGMRWVDDTRILVAGQSYGGLATVALGTQAVPGVRGLLNFAGGLRDDADACDWRGALVAAFAHYGANNKIPSLWMYGANDSLFDPALVGRMHAAFVGMGGRARRAELGVFKRDAHGMAASRDGEKFWWRDTERFLEQIGMPTREIHTVAAAPVLPRSNFAEIGDIDAIPYLGENGRAAYRAYLGKMTPRAFALSPSGAWCWAEEGEQPDVRALETCAEKSNGPCTLYSVDDYVVWPNSVGSSTAESQPPVVAPTQTAQQ
ncbi:dienelactone hydrolase [Massilia glaciei]|uniref:Dienelactone hydrolase n=2 Tax=Massilia glaciei TaxID=1524097 RepID=A0A2U2HDI4_9BURK|nr:dienelactone hydrolase [Massilia glaciei]